MCSGSRFAWPGRRGYIAGGRRIVRFGNDRGALHALGRFPCPARRRRWWRMMMSDSGPGNTGSAWRSGTPNFQPHAFDPWLQPDLFRGVLTRRVFAFLIDLVVLSIPVILACVFIALFSVVTLGLGWALFCMVSPGSVTWALIFY